MFKKLINLVFRKSVCKCNTLTPRKHRFVNYEKAQTVMLLYQCDYSEKNPEIHNIVESLKADGKKVMAWGYANKKEITSHPQSDVKIFCHKDVGSLKRLKKSFLQELEKYEYDLLIDLSVNEIVPLQYVALYAKATCKAGLKKNEQPIYDFVLDVGKSSKHTEASLSEQGVTYIYNQIIFYLKSIQTSD